MNKLLSIYRIIRVIAKQMVGLEPIILVRKKIPLKYHGNKGYGGWCIPEGFINQKSIVLDIGIGEDISFSQSLISMHRCTVHGFDPTPKAISFVENLKPEKFILHKYGLGGHTRMERFFLPNETNHVSGSISQAVHLGAAEITVQLLGFSDILKLINEEKITILKIDIEGAEYEFIESLDFANLSSNINILCIEFHHRWTQFGAVATRKAVKKLEDCGFTCVWRATESNEEFTFVRS
ncbi:FkbM family methyltransferase [Limnohabitans sp. 2KL-51]|uniref:FkbM family methyltransferase n=1 Tax=Limnohabitans sp. 2KL-51 TaxID=1977911 RepID=UPI000D38174B|nr:FkbM family methyltransferase [Limnohabitans sp. 2KL-51]PUE47643.1 hypothetical protein B9Z49_09720 [Limnohabitans sp. 2KL-51]